MNKKPETRPKPSPLDLVAKVRCPACQSRLDVLETPSGGRTVSVSFLGAKVESTAQALEVFQPPDAGPLIECPACRHRFDPSDPFPALPPLKH
jgi:DNA-directed RNA polymerase subunit RPC12/RpoP